MKKILILIVLFCFISKYSKSESFTKDGINYYIVSNTLSQGYTCLVSGIADNKMRKLIIPSTVWYNSHSYTVVDVRLTGSEKTTIESIQFPSTITKINNSAFVYFSALKEVIFSEGLKQIYPWAFQGCTNLKEVYIPSTVESIGTGVFSNCYNLEKVEVSPDNLLYDSRDNCNAIIETTTKTIIFGCGVTTFPESVTNIGEYAFCEMYSIKDLVVPETIKNIQKFAFEKCRNMESLTIPKSVSEIGYGTLRECTNLKKIVMQNNVPPVIPESVFNPIIKETIIYVPRGCKSAYEKAEYWKEFTIVEDTTSPYFCATPTISVVNGKITFDCETEGAKIHYTINNTNSSNNEGEVAPKSALDMLPTVTISCYATAEGYTQSETVTKTITLGSGDVNGDGVVSVADVPALVNILTGK